MNSPAQPASPPVLNTVSLSLCCLARPLLWALVLSLSATGTLKAQAQTSACSRAQQAFAAQDFRAAANLFAEAAEAEAATPSASPSDALLMQAKSLIRLNDFTAADPVLRKQIAAAPGSSPGSAQALYLLGFVLHRENKPKESLTVYTEAAAIQPPQADDLKIVALDYVLLDDYADAIRWLKRAVAADPKNADAWYSLGRAQMNQGNFVEAEHDFNQTLALNPNDSKALDNLGLSLEAQNRTDEALAAYNRAIAAQARSAHASEQPFLNLGTLLNAKSRSSEAVSPLQQAIAVAPKCPRCHEELARACLATGQEALGTREMEQAVALDPRNPRLHYQLGQIYRHAGLSAKANAELKTSSSLYGSHSTPTDK